MSAVDIEVDHLRPDSPLVEVSNADGSTGLRLFSAATTDPERTRAIVLERYYASFYLDADPNEVDLSLRRNVDNFDSDEGQLVILGSPGGLIDTLVKSEDSSYSTLIAAMGYRWSPEEPINQDSETASIRLGLEYPTVASLNAFVGAALPGEENIRFEEYDGGAYTTEEFMEAFAERGEILISTRQPWELHEHAALHTIGWLGIGGEFLLHLRNIAGAYLERAKAEGLLPPVPGIAEHWEVARFLSPSSEVLKHLMARTDVLSNEVANAILFDSESRKLEKALEACFFSTSGRNIPQTVLPWLGYKQAEKFGNDIRDRYRRAKEAAQALVSAREEP